MSDVRAEAKVEKETVLSELERVELQCVEVHRAFDNLCDKVSPIILPTPPSEAAEKGVGSGDLSSLHDRLSRVNYQLKEARDRIVGLTELIDL